MTKAKKVVYPVHKHGKYSSFDEFEDGSFRPAPMYLDCINGAVDEIAAIDATLASVTRECNRLMLAATNAKRNFWEKIADDYGIDVEQGWKIGPDNIVRRVKKDEP